MTTKKAKSGNFKKTLKKKQEHILEDVENNYIQTIKHGKQLGKESLDKINQVTNNTANFLKSQEYLKTLKINSLKIRERGLEQKNTLIKSRKEVTMCW